jgi:inosine-uridine nucleoside N-ribohydrolase
MVPLEVTHQALATDEIIKRLRNANRPVANFAADLLIYFADSYKNVFGFPSPPVHDPCAVATVIDPTIVSTSAMYVEVETTSQLSAGRTVCDVYNKLGQPANAHVGYGLDVERFWDMLIEVLVSY